MTKKFLINLVATSTTFSMLIAPSLTAFAAEEDATSTVTANNETVTVGNITITDGSSAVDADNKANVTVKGDVTTSGTNNSYTDNTNAVHPTASPAIDADNSTVTVNGNITAGTNGAEQTAIDADNSTVTVKGNVSGTAEGVTAKNNSEVTINGNVVGGSTGITASSTTDSTGSSTVTVNGNVTSHGLQTDIYDQQGQTIVGTSQVDHGIYSSGENNITVNGDIYSVYNGVEINIGNSDYTNDGQIIVTGTITGDVGIQVHDNNSSAEGVYSYQNSEDFLEATPTIIVYEIDSDSPISVSNSAIDTNTESGRSESNQTYNAVKSAINYIIKQSTDYGITISGDNITKYTNGSSVLNTVNINEAFTVAATLPDGYTISGGDNVSVVNNNDGTFTLTLKNSNGGIYVKAMLIPVSNADGTISYVVETEPTEIRPYEDPNQVPAGAIVTATNFGDTDASAFVAAISGSKPAQTVSFSMANITPQQYKNSIISSVASVPANGAFNIVTDRVACLDAGMIEALSARSDIDINVVFAYGGKQIKVTIPAGYDLSTLLDEYGYCGFLRLMSILGYTEI